jgi:alpha-N-arabinofuranosidase
MAWHTIESNQFGTNDFIEFCRVLGTEPYLVVNCGDGGMREARDWVEYCNGTQDTALVKLRRQHGYDQPHQVKYWGIGNEVDGPWQIGFKTPDEYARATTEFGKVMKWADPNIKLIVNGVSNWDAADFVERGQLLLEQAGNLIDYLALHWYVDNPNNDFAAFMALSELFEDRLQAYEGLVKAVQVEKKNKRPIYLAVDEWNVWHKVPPEVKQVTEIVYNLEDALVVAMQLNAFIRHARSVRMANIAQIVNVLAPILTKPDGMALQTIFYPFELFSRLAGTAALDVFWDGDTFTGGEHTAVRTLDVAATFHPEKKEVVLFVINRSERDAAETVITLGEGKFGEQIRVETVNGPGIKVQNTFEKPDQVTTATSQLKSNGSRLNVTFAPHSVTALVCPVG